MKDLTFGTLLAVFEEIFGAGLFWTMAVLAAVIGVLFLFALVRDRGVEARRFVRAQLAAPIGAVASVVFVMFMTNSGLRDIGGPIDLIVLLMIGVGGAVGATLLAYLVQAYLRPAS